MRLLLINPRHPESFWSFRWAVREIRPGKRALNPPLGLATLAALCPPDWHVSIVDENVESVPLAPPADIVGVCGMGVQYERQRELIEHYRRSGYFVVAGGSYASLCPERYRDLADTVIAGEAEYIWPQFCADYARGAARPLYRETGVVRLEDSPLPRFELLKLDRYTTATLQFSRGCPYRCEFCDIIVMFGRRPRHKSIPQIERELDRLRELGARNLFFVDDNLIGHRTVARDLLRALARYQARHAGWFRFGTEVSLNLAQDAELVALFQAARFEWVFIGIESPDPATLKAALKTQNLREDPIQAVRRLYAHGIDVLAGFIVGFDDDTPETFRNQERFIVRSGIQAAMVGLLTALPHTPLYDRVQREGRLRPDGDGSDNTRPRTNIRPRRMTYEALIASYEGLYRTLLADRNVAARVRNKLRYLRHPPAAVEYSRKEQLAIVARLVLKGVLPGGPRRVVHFLRSLPLTAPRVWPRAIVDWIVALSMKDYVERHFAPQSRRAARHTEKLVRRLVGAADKRLAVSFTGTAMPMVDVSLRDGFAGRSVPRVARRLRRLLAKTHARLTIHAESLQRSQAARLHELTDRLARYGDRISVVIDRRLHDAVRVDSSVFHLVLRN